MIKIITDSTCDLQSDRIAELGISVLPLNINFSDRSYQDGIEITREEFYKVLTTSENLPTTSTPSIGEVQRLFEKAVDDGATKIVAIHISEVLSGTINTVRSAAQQFTKIPITVIDSGQLSIGTGFQVEAAAKLANTGGSVDQILDTIRKIRGGSFVAAGLKGMEFLRRSGRVNNLISGIGGLINLRPILTMRDGIVKSELARTKMGAYRKLFGYLTKDLPLMDLVILHSNTNTEELLEFADLLKNLTGRKTIPTTNITPVIGTHLGPGAIGFGSIKSL